MKKRQPLKRAFDIAASLGGLVLFAPVMVVTAATMGVVNRSFPVFVQKRVGHKEKPFTIIKIKSLNDKKDEHGNLLPVEQRASKIGRFIRKTRADELPQFLNILKGDMSLVGPRPLLIGEQTADDAVRCSVKPGLTGLAQVFLMNGAREKIIAYDKEYAERLEKSGAVSNLVYDLGIIAATPKALFTHRKSPTP